MIKAIFASTLNGVIGVDGTLPWHIREDMRHFKETTMGCPVIMGRNTWESFGGRPLPGRLNLVVSSAEPYFHSINDAIDKARRETDGDIFIIGGAKLFESAMPLIEEWIVTEIPFTLNAERATKFTLPMGSLIETGRETVNVEQPSVVHHINIVTYKGK